jgi:predicted DNA-binding antitoxin AbrB/MazE fold protein
MTPLTTVLAVYQGGVLRPAQPLPLAEGTEVRVTLEPAAPPQQPFDQADWERRIRSAKTIQEWVELANALPPTDDGYDLLKALDENRRLAGERPLYPPDAPEETP